ncbi:hypothetical protein [Rouxiella sp. Mn2063]
MRRILAVCAVVMVAFSLSGCILPPHWGHGGGGYHGGYYQGR